MPQQGYSLPPGVIENLRHLGLSDNALRFLVALKIPLFLAVLFILGFPERTANTDFLFNEKFRKLDPDAQEHARREVLALLQQRQLPSTEEIESQIEKILDKWGKDSVVQAADNVHRAFNIGIFKVDPNPESVTSMLTAPQCAHN